MNRQPIHIGLNAHLLSLSQSYRGAGISWYIINLLKRLKQASPEFFQYNTFLSERAFQAQGLDLCFSRLPTQKPATRILWEQFIQPFLLRRLKVELLHALAFVAPVAAPCPFITTIYDLSFMRYPEAFRPFQRWYLTHFTAYSARRARAVITISESTRQDVINLLGIPPERVQTIYCGADDYFRPLPPAEVAAFKTTQGLPNRFALYLGTLEPRKNVAGLIRAYARWRAQDPKALPLVVAGGKGWYYEQIFELVEALGLKAWVRFPGYVPQEALPLWYNAATLFVYPSLFEGFGLPVLEAMACGAPVITSTASSLPEVAGHQNNARMVAPEDIETLAATLAEVANNADLQAMLRHNGLAQAANFRWEKTARETAALYQKVLGL